MYEEKNSNWRGQWDLFKGYIKGPWVAKFEILNKFTFKWEVINSGEIIDS